MGIRAQWPLCMCEFYHQASFVSKILCIFTLYAWVFFSTLLPWDFIFTAELRNFSLEKPGLGVKFDRQT